MKQKRTQVRPAQAKADGICRDLLRVRRHARRLVGKRNRKRCGGYDPCRSVGLVMLLQCPGEIVTREELQKKLWPAGPCGGIGERKQCNPGVGLVRAGLRKGQNFGIGRPIQGRYADDCHVYVGSQRSGQRVMAEIIGFLEQRLKLKVNARQRARQTCQSAVQ